MKKNLLILILTFLLISVLVSTSFAQSAFIEDYSIFAKNELIVVIPRDNPGKILKFADLGKRDLRISIGQPKAVPAGRYALEVLQQLQTIDPNLAKSIRSNVISQEPNVRGVLDKVVQKEVDAGFVYVSDSRVADSKVKVIAIPKNIQVTDVKFAIAVLKSSKNPQLAKEFIKYLKSKEGQAILVRHGFKEAAKLTFPYKKLTTNYAGQTVTVFAGAGVKNAFTEVAGNLEKMYGIKVNFEFSSSGPLKTKIENGAPTDLFATADVKDILALTK